MATCWSVIAESVRGDAHLLEGLPNQDAVECVVPNADVAIAAVADGHGAAIHFRSAAGSRLAVQAAVTVLRDALPRLRGFDAVRRERFVHEEFPERLVQAWRESVLESLQIEPVSAAERASLGALEGPRAVKLVDDDPAIAYGSTVIVALAGASFVALWHLGDGDALVMRADGTTYRPLPRDERLDGVLTTSLCAEDAVRDVRAAVLDGEAARVRWIALYTDGYANAHPHDEALQRALARIDEIDATHGAASLARELPALLREASLASGGDDATIALVRAERVADGAVVAGAAGARPGASSPGRADASSTGQPATAARGTSAADPAPGGARWTDRSPQAKAAELAARRRRSIAWALTGLLVLVLLAWWWH